MNITKLIKNINPNLSDLFERELKKRLTGKLRAFVTKDPNRTSTLNVAIIHTYKFSLQDDQIPTHDFIDAIALKASQNMLEDASRCEKVRKNHKKNRLNG